MNLVRDMLNGSLRSLGKLMSLMERESPEVPQVIKTIYPYLGKAYSVGITGLPGAGKSTIVDRFITIARAQGLSIGAIAIDPTSPFSGGAVLGDRIRMQQHCSDPDVFIRSMGTRGNRGGLPAAARNVMKLLDAFGKDLIIVETVGVGQTELDIVDSVDTSVVVLGPESGDSVQCMKGGLMEIGNIFVVNKVDIQGGDKLVAELESASKLGLSNGCWQPPVLATQAVNDIGIDELYQQVIKHREFLEANGTIRDQRRKQRKEELLRTVERRFRNRALSLLESDAMIPLLHQVENNEVDPYSAADMVEIEALGLKAKNSEL